MRPAMNRQMYETAADRDREYQVACKFAQMLNAVPRATPVKYPFDYTFEAGKYIVANAEIKCRNMPSDRADVYEISLHKMMMLTAFAQLSTMPMYLIVQFADCVAFCRIEEGMFTAMRNGGRSDRDDVQDIEPLALIPMARFTKL